MGTSKWFKIIPVAFVMYMLAYMDRINIGILIPYMQKDLNLTSSVAGDIAGIFFWGYLILQIPGGILATKWSARKFIFYSDDLMGHCCYRNRIGADGRAVKSGPLPPRSS